MVDVGGGHGALMSAILKANPQVRGIVCDMAHVVEGAGPVLEAAGVADRCEVAACDFFEFGAGWRGCLYFEGDHRRLGR